MKRAVRPVLDFLHSVWWAFCRVVLKQRYSASSEEREQVRQRFYEWLAASWWEADTLLRRLYAPESMRGAGIAEAMVELSYEYAQSDQILAQLNAIETELEHLKSLREGAGDDPEEYLTRVREYQQAHPNSRLGHGFLLNALKQAGYTDEAISFCRQALSPKNSPVSNYYTHLRLGKFLLEKRDWDGALQQKNLAEEYKHALPNFRAEKESLIPARILIARARRSSGDETGARHLLRKCLNATLDQNIQEAIRNVMTEAGA